MSLRPKMKQDDQKAARFLIRTTFGPTYDDIERVKRLGLSKWLETQFNAARPESYSRFLLRENETRSRGVGRMTPVQAFWTQALLGQDQLKQRMVFALSQIFVVSFSDFRLAANPDAITHYMDLLYSHAFGNFRDLLGAVSRSPAMSHFLTFHQNMRADTAQGRKPDENYAREVMQLFTIGLWQLNPNGTPKRSTDGDLIPTYDLDDITQMARVFTGWSWGGGFPTKERWRGALGAKGTAKPVWDQPIIPYKRYYEAGEKSLLDTIKIQKGTSAQESLDIALDALFDHPNTPPFFALRLIQRFTTSNPSPDYVRRVAAAFEDNGDGIRGDLKATLFAVLSDPDVSVERAPTPEAGKLREPLVRILHFFRAYGDHSVIDGAKASYRIYQLCNQIGQLPFGAPSVFNWYTPDYQTAGPSANAGLVAPEFKLHEDDLIITYFNALSNLVFRGLMGDKEAVTYPELEALSLKPKALVDRLNIVLCAGEIGEDEKKQIVRALNTIPRRHRKKRAISALLMALMSPDFLIEA